MILSSKTKIFFSFSSRPGVFGSTIYNRLFKELNIDAVYIPRPANTADGLVSSIKAIGASGASISSPLKSDVVNHLDSVSREVQITNSCNTILIKDSRAHGYNTDIEGAKLALSAANLTVRKALIYGSGAVTPSLYFALKKLYNCDVYFIARNPELSPEQKRFFPAAQMLNDENYDLLINATPSQTDSNPQLRGLIKKVPAYFDLNVSKTDTPSIELAKMQSSTTISGMEMACGQLVDQFHLYTGLQTTLGRVQELAKDLYNTRAK